MKGQLHIDSLYAFVVRDDDGSEGLAAVATGMGMMPLLAADEARLASLEPLAQQVADATGKIVQLVRFTTREEVRLVTPNRAKPQNAVDLGGGMIGLP